MQAEAPGPEGANPAHSVGGFLAGASGPEFAVQLSKSEYPALPQREEPGEADITVCTEPPEQAPRT